MNKSDIQNTIINYLRNYNPEYVGLFGSFVREDSTKNSDIDVLIRFRDNFSLLTLIRIENELIDLLGIKVDILTEGSLKNDRVKRSIYQDLKIIYEA